MCMGIKIKTRVFGLVLNIHQKISFPACFTVYKCYSALLTLWKIKINLPNNVDICLSPYFTFQTGSMHTRKKKKIGKKKKKRKKKLYFDNLAVIIWQLIYWYLPNIKTNSPMIHEKLGVWGTHAVQIILFHVQRSVLLKTKNYKMYIFQ